MWLIYTICFLVISFGIALVFHDDIIPFVNEKWIFIRMKFMIWRMSLKHDKETKAQLKTLQKALNKCIMNKDIDDEDE